MSDLLNIGDAPANTPALIKDATIETFMADVIEASQKNPVIVDFWATWCGPCKTLGPMLEKAVTALGGKVQMVKVDIDKNQMLAQQLRIQSVPTVMAFIAGQPVDGFAGAVPESEIKAFLDRAVKMAAQAGLGDDKGAGFDLKAALQAADQALAGGDIATAGGIFGQIAEQAGEDDDARLLALGGLARCYLAMGEIAQAQSVLDTVPVAKRNMPGVSNAFAALALAATKVDDSELSKLKALAAQNPTDHQAQFDYAVAQIASNDMEGATETLLAQIAKDRQWNDGAAKAKLLTIFEALGAADPITTKARRKLSSILFS